MHSLIHQTMTATPDIAHIWNSTVGVTRLIDVSDVAVTDDNKTLHAVRSTVSKTAIPLIYHDLDSRNPVIVKSGILAFVALIGFVGNGTALATIRLTPKLRTKTYALLASLTVSDLIVGLTLLWTTGYQLVVYVFSENPCSYVILAAALAWPGRVPAAITMMHVGLISVERYIAIVHSLHYESWVTDRTIKMMIVFGWIFPGIPCAMYLTYLGRINWQTCTIMASILQSAVMDTCYILVVIVVIIVLYACIMTVALRQRAKINAEVSAICIRLYKAMEYQ
jgi:7 transmembrane receptor (rhodopsin family)